MKKIDILSDNYTMYNTGIKIRSMIMKKLLVIAILPLITSIASCSNDKPQEKQYFSKWNECQSLTTLKNFVNKAVDRNSDNYIPKEDRIATFDMDGTFIGELYPSYFEYNMLEYRVLDDVNYKDTAPIEVKEVAQEIRDFVRNGTPLPDHFDLRHAHAAAKAYSGMSLKQFDDYVTEYAKKTPFGFTGMTYATSFYQPMLEVFDYLNDNDFTVYVVSGSDRLLCRSLVRPLGIEPNRVIGMDVRLRSTNQGYVDGVDYTQTKTEELFRTDELIIKNLKENKVTAIAKEIGKVPVLSFGNSSGDSAMHNYCLSNSKYHTEAFMVLADDYEDDHANQTETESRKAKWIEAQYNIISMHDDFKTIYGENVVKTDFHFDPSPVEEKTYEEFLAIAATETPAQPTKANVYVNKVETDTYLDRSPSSWTTELYLEATYDSGTQEWNIEGETDPTITAYRVFVGNEAKDLTQDHAIFNPLVFQNKDIHYYVGDGYRFRFRGSGQMVVSTATIKNALFGERIFDDDGLLIFVESNSSVTGVDGTTSSTVELVYIEYVYEV